MRDERIQAADRELYYTLRKREETVGDVRRCMVVGASFVHRLLKPLKKLVQELELASVWRWLLVRHSRIVDQYRRQFDELGWRSLSQGGVHP